MKKNNFEQYEEDAILLNYDDSFMFSSKKMKEIALHNIFSFHKMEDLSFLLGNDKDYMDLLQSIGKNLELLKLYVAANFSTVADYGIKKGIPFEVASQLKRTGLLNLSKAETEEDIKKCNAEFCENFHKKYKELHHAMYSDYVERAIDAIHFYKRKQVSSCKIAKALNVNESYLSRIFRQETGKTISEYILMVKMEQAKLLLSSHVYSLTEIAELLGYSSYSYFSQRFKKYFGISPEKYIKNEEF